MTANDEQEELAKQKVRDRHPTAFQSAKGTVWSERGMTKIRLGTTWQNAAESLPPEAEQDVDDIDCRRCHRMMLIRDGEESTGICDHCCQEIVGSLPVEGKDKCQVCKRPLIDGLCREFGKLHAQTEPKPTPSTPVEPIAIEPLPCPFCGRKALFFRRSDGAGECVTCTCGALISGTPIHPALPLWNKRVQPQPSSISTEPVQLVSNKFIENARQQAMPTSLATALLELQQWRKWAAAKESK